MNPLVLPLRCSLCGWMTEILSTDPMPRCEVCHGKMRPNGIAREATDLDLARDCKKESDDVGLAL